MPDIFDQLDGNKNAPKGDIFDETANMPSRARSLVSAPVKGAIKGAVDLSALGDPTSLIINLLSEGKFGSKDLTPHQKQVLEKFLPTRDEPLERGLERAGRIGITAFGGPEGVLAAGGRTLGAAALGQIAEEAGAPDWAQSLAELLAFTTPKPGKGLLPKKTQTEAVEFLRGKGLTDKEIAPLLKSEKRIRSLGRLSKKGPKTEELTRNISEKLGEGYEFLKTEGAEKFLRGKDVTHFDEKLTDTLEKIRPRFARLIEKDVETLRNKGISQKNLIDFYQDINDIVGAEEGGKAVLSTLKKPILEGLEKIDPKSAKEFTKLNEFYAKKAVLSKALKPDMIDAWLKKGKAYGAIYGVATANPKFLKGLVSEEVASRIFREILINPKLQNLSNQILKSISENKIPAAIRAYEFFIQELQKKDPEASNKLKFQEPRSSHKD